MKAVVISTICLVVVVLVVKANENSEKSLDDLDLVPSERTGCAGFKEKCTEGDDCSCCGDRGKCDCNWHGKPGCYCMQGLIWTGLKKIALCKIGK